jgi:hypothetical protein
MITEYRFSCEITVFERYLSYDIVVASHLDQ